MDCPPCTFLGYTFPCPCDVPANGVDAPALAPSILSALPLFAPTTTLDTPRTAIPTVHWEPGTSIFHLPFALGWLGFLALLVMAWSILAGVVLHHRFRSRRSPSRSRHCHHRRCHVIRMNGSRGSGSGSAAPISPLSSRVS